MTGHVQQRIEHRPSTALRHRRRRRDQRIKQWRAFCDRRTRCQRGIDRRDDGARVAAGGELCIAMRRRASPRMTLRSQKSAASDVWNAMCCAVASPDPQRASIGSAGIRSLSASRLRVSSFKCSDRISTLAPSASFAKSLFPPQPKPLCLCGETEKPRISEAHRFGQRPKLCCFRLAPQAARAHLHAHRAAVHVDELAVQVRLERAVRLGRFALPTAGVLVADVAAEGGPFAADCANRRHVYARLRIGTTVLDS